MYGSNLTSFMTISMDLMKLCSYMCAKATDIFWLALRFLALSIDKWPAALPPLTAAATFWLTWIFFMSRKHSSFVKQVDPPQSLINEKIWSFLIIGPIFLCCLSGWLFVGFPQSKNASIICFSLSRLSFLSGIYLRNSTIISLLISFSTW